MSDDDRQRITEFLEEHREGYALPQQLYIDPDLFALEQQNIFKRMWLYAGHVSQIPDTGDFFTVSVFGESIIIDRDEDGRINALYNVCRHRGSRVCLAEFGQAKAFVCPYHAWTYGLDGTLHHAGHMTEQLCSNTYALHRCHVRVMAGFIFICLAEAPPDFDLIERDLLPLAEPHGYPDARIAHHESVVLACNWKVLGENFSECYHCGPAHPEYCSRVLYAAEYANPHLAEESKAVAARAAEHFDRLNLPRKHVGGAHKAHFAGRNALRAGSVSMSESGRPVAPRMGTLADDDAGNLCLVVRPMFILEACADHATVLRFTPITVQDTAVDVFWFVRGDAVEGEDYQLDELIWLWKATGEQDFELCKNNQAGINSAKYQPGPLSGQERGVTAFHDWYKDQLMSAG